MFLYKKGLTMKRTIFPLALLFSIPVAMNAMQEAPEQKKGSSLVKLEYTGPDRISRAIDTQSLSKCVVPEDQLPYLAEQMQMMGTEIACSTLPNDALKEFQKLLLTEKKPWESEKDKVKNLLSAQTRELKSEYRKHETDCRASEYADEKKQFLPWQEFDQQIFDELDNLNAWKTSVAAQKDALKKLMVARYLKSLLKLQELDRTTNNIEGKLKTLLPQATAQYEKEQSSGEHIPA